MPRFLKLAFLAAAPWPFVRAALTPAVGRAYPRRTAIGVLCLVLYAAVVVVLALVAPWLLLPVAIAAVAGMLGRMWLGRAGYGARRRLPPGRLEVLPVRPFTDREYIAAHLRRHGPIAKVTVPTLPAPSVCVLGLRRGAAVLSEHRDRLGPVGIAFDPLIPARFLRNMDPDLHRDYKKVFHDAFRSDVVTACERDFDRLAREELDRLAAAGDEVDPVPFLIDYAVGATVRLFFGIARGHPDFERAVELYATLGRNVELDAADGPKGRAVAAVAEELAVIVHRQAEAVESARARGQEAPPSFLAELVRLRPDGLGDPSLVLNHVFLVRTSSADMSALLAWVMKTLADNPSWSRRLGDQPADAGLARRIVLETLRLHQSEFIQRRVLEPIEIDGYAVPAGWFLRVCVHESHRDPNVFERPDTFDPDRFRERTYSRHEYSPFGTLEHACIGADTTISVCGIFTRALAERDWAVVRDGRPEFLRYHWEPSRHIRVRVSAAAELPEAVTA